MMDLMGRKEKEIDVEKTVLLKKARNVVAILELFETERNHCTQTQNPSEQYLSANNAVLTYVLWIYFVHPLDQN